MVTHKLFLRWWLFAILIVISACFCHYLNLYNLIWEKDDSKLCFVIFAIFTISSVSVGWATYLLSKALGSILAVESLWVKEYSRGEFEKFRYQELLHYKDKILSIEETGWFVADACLTLGMIGTVLGFITMLMNGMAGVDPANPASIQRMLNAMSSGMSTALYTTAVGLICSLALKVQLFNLSNEIARLNRGGEPVKAESLKSSCSNMVIKEHRKERE